MAPEKTNRISFQGEPGANSDTACRNMFPGMEPLPCPTFEDAFNAVETGKADLAMIPIENTIAGRVADIHHLLPESKLHIVGEYFLPIHFQLMVLPGVERKEIKTVHSHIHALGQCRKYIRKNGWKPVVAGDTAGAAKLVGEVQDRTMAALAPRLAASLYGLDILEENVEDTDTNVTRFVVLTKTKQWVERPSPDARMMTTFIFRVRNVPAALYKAMGGFATNGVNMTKLESYQLGAFTATLFYADIEGHPDDAECEAGAGRTALLLARDAHPRRLSAQRVARGMESRGLGLVQRHVVDLQKGLDFGDPAVAHIGDVDGMVVVALVGGLVGELHRVAEVEVVLRADLAELFEPLDAGNVGRAPCRRRGRIFPRPSRADVSGGRRRYDGSCAKSSG